MHISLRQKIDYSQWFFWQILHSEKNIEAAHTHWDKIMIFLSTWKIRQIVTFINYIVPNQVNLTNYFQIAISLEKFVKLQHTLTKKCKTKSIWRIIFKIPILLEKFVVSVCVLQNMKEFSLKQNFLLLFPYLDAFNTKGKKTMRFPRQKTNEVALSSI